ncbi:MAG: QueT transporter family protein [Candidatus Bathyarchaeia archaeon]
MEFDARDIALSAIMASLYAVINIVQTAMGGPITYGPVQLRIADCLIPLSALFGWPVIFGVAVGCFSNAYYWLDPADVVIGPIVNFVASLLIYLLRRRRAFACIVGGVAVGLPIGMYLYYLYLMGNPAVVQAPDFGFSLPAYAAFVVSLVISSLIVVAGVGYALLRALSAARVTESMKSRGLKVLA